LPPRGLCRHLGAESFLSGAGRTTMSGAACDVVLATGLRRAGSTARHRTLVVSGREKKNANEGGARC
jgi:hypothetical protein